MNDILSISISEPLVRGAGFLTNISGKIQSYSHTISAWLGYDRASISFETTKLNQEDWISDGLGRHIDVYDESQGTIFEGFVNEISIDNGGLSVTRGPFLDIKNRVQLVYSTILTGTSGEQIFGARVATSVVNDTVSQGKYGIRYGIASSGGVSASEAQELTNNILASFKNPDTSHSLSSSGGSSPRVSLSILGYCYWLKYPYSSTTTGTQNVSTKIQNIISGEPNGIISTDFSKITTNTLQTKAYEQDYDDGLSLIKGIINQGDTNDNRYIFGVYNDRVARYEQIPTTIEYQQQLESPAQQIQFISGQRVYPWNVLPGKWLILTDFMIGKITPTDIKQDSRVIFIEQVTYTAPYSISIVGGKVDSLNQILAKMGLGGISI